MLLKRTAIAMVLAVPLAACVGSPDSSPVDRTRAAVEVACDPSVDCEAEVVAIVPGVLVATNAGAVDEDADGEGAPLDCNDLDPWIGTLAPEVPCNGIDDDCSGSDACAPDADGDGWSGTLDCDDASPERNPGQFETHCDGIDNDCDGFDYCDADQDGRPAHVDCDDADASRFPGAPEVPCDGIDQDCDGTDGLMDSPCGTL